MYWFCICNNFTDFETLIISMDRYLDDIWFYVMISKVLNELNFSLF